MLNECLNFEYTYSYEHKECPTQQPSNKKICIGICGTYESMKHLGGETRDTVSSFHLYTGCTQLVLYLNLVHLLWFVAIILKVYFTFNRKQNVQIQEKVVNVNSVLIKTYKCIKNHLTL